MSTAEKLCRRCGDHWPADGEFFYIQPAKPGGLSTNCKACHVEMPSGQRKAMARKREVPLRSPWESLVL